MKYWNAAKMIRPIPFYIKGNFYILLALAVLTVPMQWLLSWIASVVVHELGHLICLKICDVEVESLEISGFGAKINTAPIEKYEWLCALAGPIAGLLLLPFSKWIPRIAVCAAIQSAFNLLPVYPLDGGRFLREALSQILSDTYAVKLSVWISYLVVGFLVVYVMKDWVGYFIQIIR